MSSFVQQLATMTVVLISASLGVRAQNNGDIRLVNIDSLPSDGRLEIYLNGKWGTFCGKNDVSKFDQRAADTACRQLGYERVFTPDFNIGPKAPSDTPIHVTSVSCPSDSDDVCSNDFLTHILRCSVSTAVDSTCTHDDDVGLYCYSGSQIWNKPYESQLLLPPQTDSLNISTSSSRLGVYLNNKWGLICGHGNNFDKNAAHTACRQLGYTNAVSYNASTRVPKDQRNAIFWLDGVTCGLQSYSCLQRCFKNSLPTKGISCSTGLTVSISCEFKISLEDKNTPGSPLQCDSGDYCHSPTPPSNKDSTIRIIIIVVIVALVLLAVTSCITVAVCCMVPGCIYYRRKQGYEAING